jgi:hypothetical protein
MNHRAEPTDGCLCDPAAEQVVVIAAKSGDESAFETLVKPPVEGFSCSRSDTQEFGKMPKTLSSKPSRKRPSTHNGSKGNPLSPHG